MNAKELRREIIAFRNHLVSLNKRNISWSCDPVLEFEDKENYPLDFQIFMEEIGECSASSRPEGGYQILSLDRPLTLQQWNKFVINPLIPNNETVLDINGSTVLTQNVRLIATDVDMQFYGFNISKKPYEFFSIWGVDWAGDSIIGVSFWSWFEKHMSDSIEYLR